MEDDLKKNEMEEDLIFLEKLEQHLKKMEDEIKKNKMEDDLKKIKNEDDLNFFFFFLNGR